MLALLICTLGISVAAPGLSPSKDDMLLPSVIVQGYTVQQWNKLHPDIPAHSLGPSQSKSLLISQDSISKGLELLARLHTMEIDAWMDRTVQHTQYNSDDFDDPNLTGQWYIDSLEMYTLWTHSLGDVNTRVAVIDSGIDIAHPDLSEKVVAPYDAFDDDDDPSPNPGEYCWEGAGSAICDEHGTAVAGISVADANDAGIVGLCPDCSLIPIKMLGEGNATLSYDVAAMEHALANDAAVINNSWGYVQPMEAPEALVNVIERAQVETRDGKGAVVVFAAGNDNRELIENELCGIDGVICVSAVDSYGRPTAYTNYGNDVDLAAPSATVSIAPNETLTTNFGGTSAAAPVVSGLAAWVLSVEPDLTSTEVVDLLISTSEQSPLITPDENGHHDKYGYGIINPMNVYESLYPPEIEEPAKGGCNALAVFSPSVKFYPILLGLLTLFGLVRRR